MCNRCLQLDEKLRHFRRIAARVNDELTDEALDALALEHETQKLAFHPEANE
jgi:hypothetical protein